MNFWGCVFQNFPIRNQLTANTHNDFRLFFKLVWFVIFFDCVIEVIHNRCALIELFLLN